MVIVQCNCEKLLSVQEQSHLLHVRLTVLSFVKLCWTTVICVITHCGEKLGIFRAYSYVEQSTQLLYHFGGFAPITLNGFSFAHFQCHGWHCLPQQVMSQHCLKQVCCLMFFLHVCSIDDTLQSVFEYLVSWSENKKFHHIGSISTHFYMLLGFSVVFDSELTVAISLGSGIQRKNVLSTH